jgi:hypothetical protein
MRIKKITTTGDEFVWTVSTDRGDTEIRTRGRGSLIRVDGKIFIIDTNDDAFEIDLSVLDRKSLQIISSIL